MFRFVPFCLLLAAVILVGTASAQDEQGGFSVDQLRAGWEESLTEVEAYASGPEHTPQQHDTFNAQLAKIKSEAAEVNADAQQEMTTYARLLEALGPPPEEGEPPEPVDIKIKREDLNAKINVHRSRMAQAELAIAEAEQAEAKLSEIVRKKFRERLLVRGPLPLAPDTVTQAVPEFFTVLGVLTDSYSEWSDFLSDDEVAEARWRGAMVLLAFVAAWFLRRFLLTRYGRDSTIEKPSYPRRFLAAVAEGVARGTLPASIFAVPLILIPLGMSIASGLFAEVVSAFCSALIFFVLGVAFTRAILAPDLPTWRLTHLAPRSARILSRRICFLIAVFAIDIFFSRSMCVDFDCSIRTVSISPELESLYSLIIDSFEAIGIVLVVQGWLWRSSPVSPGAPEDGTQPAGQDTTVPTEEPKEQMVGGRVWTYARRAVGIVAVCGVIANLIGYVNLGDRMIDGLSMSGAILGVLLLVRRLLRELMRFGLAAPVITHRLGLAENNRDLILFWLGVIDDVVLFVVACYAILPIWGMPRTDLTRGIGDLLKGFSVGGVTISLVDILTALIVFFIAFAITRLIRQTLSEKVLAKTNLDTGIRNSLASGVSYVGITIAALLAVGVMGFNFQNIAIVAGALSVGIGFGLQNIVNNFVSGLILLVERPIKIGDWVVVGEHQGFVKRISVRATEIETFDRASVILPNSELLSNAVMNWTHKDKIGRLIIMVGVAYGCDTERVRGILLSCSEDHPEIVSWPKPFVLFQNFGGSSLDFELRAYLRDVGSRLSVSSDLRFAIDKAFREEGIEIPFSQHDIHLRDIDRLEQALAALKTESRPAAGDVASPAGSSAESKS